MGRVLWHEALVASLCEHKRDGRLSFDASFKLALLSNPPRSSIDRDILASVRQFTQDAWFGQRPGLRHFTLDMLATPDGTGWAKTSGSFQPWRRDTRAAA